jgi:hypothetical protein
VVQDSKIRISQASSQAQPSPYADFPGFADEPEEKEDDERAPPTRDRGGLFSLTAVPALLRTKPHANTEGRLQVRPCHADSGK